MKKEDREAAIQKEAARNAPTKINNINMAQFLDTITDVARKQKHTFGGVSAEDFKSAQEAGKCRGRTQFFERLEGSAAPGVPGHRRVRRGLQGAVLSGRSEACSSPPGPSARLPTSGRTGT